MFSAPPALQTPTPILGSLDAGLYIAMIEEFAKPERTVPRSTTAYPFSNQELGFMATWDGFIKAHASLLDKMDLGMMGVNLRGLEKHPNLSEIQIYTPHMTFNGKQTVYPIVVLKRKGKQDAEVFIACGSVQTILALSQGQKKLPANFVEYITPANKIDSLNKEMIKHRWENGNWDRIPLSFLGSNQAQSLSNIMPYDVYDKIYDPITIKNVFEYTAKFKLNTSEHLTILDMGAGKGRLAKKIIQEAKKRNIPLVYLFLEPTECQIDEAKKIAFI